jgi:hypothetical protein
VKKQTLLVLVLLVFSGAASATVLDTLDAPDVSRSDSGVSLYYGELEGKQVFIYDSRTEETLFKKDYGADNSQVVRDISEFSSNPFYTDRALTACFNFPPVDLSGETKGYDSGDSDGEGELTFSNIDVEIGELRNGPSKSYENLIFARDDETLLCTTPERNMSASLSQLSVEGNSFPHDSNFSVEISNIFGQNSQWTIGDYVPRPHIDPDNDGVSKELGNEDVCPFVSGKLENGCPDKDGDGVGNRFDQCPDTSGSTVNGCPSPGTQLFRDDNPSTQEYIFDGRPQEEGDNPDPDVLPEGLRFLEFTLFGGDGNFSDSQEPSRINGAVALKDLKSIELVGPGNNHEGPVKVHKDAFNNVDLLVAGGAKSDSASAAPEMFDVSQDLNATEESSLVVIENRYQPGVQPLREKWTPGTSIDVLWNGADSVGAVEARFLRDGNVVKQYTELSQDSGVFRENDFFTPSQTDNYTVQWRVTLDSGVQKTSNFTEFVSFRDIDDDGVADRDDSCPYTSGSLEDGCPAPGTNLFGSGSAGKQNIELPLGTEYIRVKARGALGLHNDPQLAFNYAKTGEASAVIPVSELPKDKFYGFIGGEGKCPSGGFNGGGQGNGSGFTCSDGGGGGGGATDLRVGGAKLSDRVIVGGGGGGQGNLDLRFQTGGATFCDGSNPSIFCNIRAGGFGGGGFPYNLTFDFATIDDAIVEQQNFDIQPGTQSNGFALGQGGDGADTSLGGGGGGGGYYGGEGGVEGWGGAGGSNFVKDSFLDQNLTKGVNAASTLQISVAYAVLTEPRSSSWSVGQPIDVKAEVTDKVQSVDVTVFEQGEKVQTEQSLPETGTNVFSQDNFFTPSTKDRRYTFEYDIQLDTGEVTELSTSAVVDRKDSDGDGTRDFVDLCPETPGRLDNGCPDEDNDGVRNALDDCPLESGRLDNGCPNTPPSAEILAPAEVQRGETFSVVGVGSDPDGQDLSYNWVIDSPIAPFVGREVSTEYEQDDVLGDKPISLTVSDGIDSTTVQDTINLNDKSYPSGTRDVDISLDLLEPGVRAELSSTPVQYKFELTANNGTAELYREDEELKTFDHEKGTETFQFTELDTPLGNQTYYVQYVRDVDGKSVSNVSSFNLTSKSDIDGDGVRDSLDDCPNTFGELASGCPDDDGDGLRNGLDVCPQTYGLKDNGCENTPPTIDSLEFDEDFNESESPEFSVSVSDPDTQALQTTWSFGASGETVTPSLNPGLFDSTVKVSDGIDSDTRSFQFNVTSVPQEEPKTDIQTNITALAPDQGKEVPDTPVDFQVELRANNGTLFIQNRERGKEDFNTITERKHSRGEKTFLVRNFSLTPDNYEYLFVFKRQADNQVSRTPLRQYELLGEPDADGDGTPDSEDVCPTDFGLKDNGCPNSPPEITSLSVPNSVDEGSTFSAAASVQDLDTEQNPNVSWSFGAQGRDVEACFDNVGFKLVEATVTDGINTSSQTQVVQVESDASASCEEFSYENPDFDDNIIPRSNITTDINISGPKDGASINPRLLKLNYDVRANIGNLKVFANSTKVADFTHFRGTTSHTNFVGELSPGNFYFWQVEYERREDGQTFDSEKGSFFLEEPPELEGNFSNDGDEEYSAEENNKTEPPDASLLDIAKVKNDKIIYEWQLNGSRGEVRLKRGGNTLFQDQKQVIGAKNYRFEERIPSPGFHFYSLNFTTEAGQVARSGTGYVFVPSPPTNISMDQVPRVVGDLRNVTYNVTVGGQRADIRFFVEGEKIFNTSKDVIDGNLSFQVEDKIPNYGSVSYKTVADFENGETQQETRSFSVFQTQPELCGDEIDNDGDGQVDEGCDSDEGSGGGGGVGGGEGQQPTPETPESEGAQIDITPRSFTADGTELEQEFLTFDNDFGKALRLDFSVADSCDVFRFRGINEYVRKANYRLESGTAPSVPVGIRAPVEGGVETCSISVQSEGAAGDYIANRELEAEVGEVAAAPGGNNPDDSLESFKIEVRSSNNTAFVDSVTERVEPIQGFFTRERDVKLCTSDVSKSFTEQNCEAPVVAELSALSVFGSVFLLMVLVGGGRRFYRDFYKGELPGEKG